MAGVVFLVCVGIVAATGCGGLFSRKPVTNDSPSSSTEPKDGSAKDGATKGGNPIPGEAGDPTGEAKTDFHYYPAWTRGVLSFRVADYLAGGFHPVKGSRGGPLLTQDLAVDDNGIGISTANVERLLVLFPSAADPDPKILGHRVKIVRTKVPVASADIKAAMQKAAPGIKFETTRVGSYSIHQRDGYTAFAVVGSRTVLYGPTAELQAVLERDKEAAVSPALKAALASADLSKMVVSVTDDLGSVHSDFSLGVQVPDVVLNSLEKRTPGRPRLVSRVSSATFNKDNVTISTTSTFADADSAARFKQRADVEIADSKKLDDQIRNMGGYPLQFTSSINGNSVTLVEVMNIALVR
jgi:hypothetical protein